MKKIILISAAMVLAGTSFAQTVNNCGRGSAIYNQYCAALANTNPNTNGGVRIGTSGNAMLDILRDNAPCRAALLSIRANAGSLRGSNENIGISEGRNADNNQMSFLLRQGEFDTIIGILNNYNGYNIWGPEILFENPSSYQGINSWNTERLLKVKLAALAALGLKKGQYNQAVGLMGPVNAVNGWEPYLYRIFLREAVYGLIRGVDENGNNDGGSYLNIFLTYIRRANINTNDPQPQYMGGDRGQGVNYLRPLYSMLAEDDETGARRCVNPDNNQAVAFRTALRDNNNNIMDYAQQKQICADLKDQYRHCQCQSSNTSNAQACQSFFNFRGLLSCDDRITEENTQTEAESKIASAQSR